MPLFFFRVQGQAHSRFGRRCFPGSMYIPRNVDNPDSQGRISLSGFWSKSLLENRGILVDFSVDSFLLIFPRKMARKIHQRIHRGYQTPKSTSNFREGVSLTDRNIRIGMMLDSQGEGFQGRGGNTRTCCLESSASRAKVFWCPPPPNIWPGGILK